MNHAVADQLRALMREHPVEALVAIREAKVATEWHEQKPTTSCSRWAQRIGVGGLVVAYVIEDRETGRATYRTICGDAYRMPSVAPDFATAVSLADADLVADGWALGALGALGGAVGGGS